MLHQVFVCIYAKSEGIEQLEKCRSDTSRIFCDFIYILNVPTGERKKGKIGPLPSHLSHLLSFVNKYLKLLTDKLVRTKQQRVEQKFLPLQ